MLYVVIDDERTFRLEDLMQIHPNTTANDPEIIHIRNSHDALAYLAKAHVEHQMKYGDVMVLFLDHDLGGDDTIEIVVDYLSVVINPAVVKAYLHSQNPVSDRLLRHLHFYEGERIPLPPIVSKGISPIDFAEIVSDMK